MNKIFIAALVFAASAFAAIPNPLVISTADISGKYHMVDTTEYLLNGVVYVESGDTLVIDSGVVIRGTGGQAANASALVVSRGGRIEACGTECDPIIFTSDNDDLDDPFDLNLGISGLWGGVIILGRSAMEIDPTDPADTLKPIEGTVSTDPRNSYGPGCVDQALPLDSCGNAYAVLDDNSGIFKYVSIRHGGVKTSTANEINGLTMGSVGSGTEIHHVEVYANLDDGFEWFGGTVNTKYLVNSYSQDDGFDFDQGYRGKNQFWFGIQNPLNSARGGEWDGVDVQGQNVLFARPTISNFTFIGGGQDADPNLNVQGDKNNPAIKWRNEGGGFAYNGIVCDFPNRGLDVDNSTFPRYTSNPQDLDMENVWFYKIKTAYGDANGLTIINDAGNNNVTGTDPEFRSEISRTPGIYCLDPRICVTSPAATAGFNPAALDAFFSSTSGYVGAFLDCLWIEKWTCLWQDCTVARTFHFNPGTSVFTEGSRTAFTLVNSHPGSFITAGSVKMNGNDFTGLFIASMFPDAQYDCGGTSLVSGSVNMTLLKNPAVGIKLGKNTLDWEFTVVKLSGDVKEYSGSEDWRLLD